MNLVKNVNCLVRQEKDYVKLLHLFSKRSLISGFGRNAESCVPKITTIAKNKSNMIANGYGGLISNVPDTTFTWRHYSSDTAGDVIPKDQVSENNIKLDNLTKMKTLMEIQVKNFFTDKLEYRAYTKDIILENNFDPNKPTITKGINSYAISALKARFYLNFMFPKLSINVTESSINEKDSLVTIYWKLNILRHSMMLSIRSALPQQSREAAKNLSDQILGMSVFHVNDKGFIDKHTLRRIDSHEAPSGTNGTKEATSQEDQKL